MYVRPKWGHHSGGPHMVEQPATNHNRPALYRVAAGTILKGARVEILGTTDQKPLCTLKPADRVAVREFLTTACGTTSSCARPPSCGGTWSASGARGRGGAGPRVHGGGGSQPRASDAP